MASPAPRPRRYPPGHPLRLLDAGRAGRAMTHEEIAEPWPMLLVAVLEDDQEEEAGQLLHRLGGQLSVA